MRDASEINFVFHWPSAPRNLTTTNTSSWRAGESTTDDTSSESSLSSTSEDDEGQAQSPSTIRNLQTAMEARERSDYGSKTRSHGARSSKRHRGSDHEYEEEEEEDTSPGAVGPTWNHVLGIRTDHLASILSPPQSLCRKRFELGVDNLVFLGYPVHVRSDGLWAKPKRKRTPKKTEGLEEQLPEEEDDDENEGNEADDEEDESTEASKECADSSPTNEKTKKGGTVERTRDFEKENTNVDAETPKMTMFHVVFVMNPPQLEYQSRVDDMYDCVVKHFTRALKEEQAGDNYVTRECNLILDLKEKALHEGMDQQELWNKIVQESNLAKVISELYVSISSSKIAHVVLNNSLVFSMKIPILTETTILPSAVEPQLPGVYLTTVTSFGEDDGGGNRDTLMVPHFALLWLEDPEDIIKEITIDDPISASLIQFIRYSRPTLSFLQIARASSMHYEDVEMLARYLIYWRKARPVPPLNHRNYYTVSPNADMKKLPTQIPIYNRLFPTLPSLPRMLSNLSTKPRPYKFLIPTVDHRSAYIDILAWLMRHGWIIQVRTFGYLKIPPEIKRICAEEKERLEADTTQKVEDKINVSSVESNEQFAEDFASEELLVKSTSSASLHPASDVQGSKDVDQNVVVLINDKPPETEYEETILLNPRELTTEESRWLEQLTKGCPPDIVALFDRMVKYLDGKQAIEKIAIREDISKAEVKRVIRALNRYLVFTRHW